MRAYLSIIAMHLAYHLQCVRKPETRKVITQRKKLSSNKLPEEPTRESESVSRGALSERGLKDSVSINRCTFPAFEHTALAKLEKVQLKLFLVASNWVSQKRNEANPAASMHKWNSFECGTRQNGNWIWTMHLEALQNLASQPSIPFPAIQKSKVLCPIFHLRNLYWTSLWKMTSGAKMTSETPNNNSCYSVLTPSPATPLLRFRSPWVLPWAPGPLWVKGWALELGESCQSWLQCLSVAWFTRITIARSPNGKKGYRESAKNSKPMWTWTLIVSLWWPKEKQINTTTVTTCNYCCEATVQGQLIHVNLLETWNSEEWSFQLTSTHLKSPAHHSREKTWWFVAITK